MPGETRDFAKVIRARMQADPQLARDIADIEAEEAPFLEEIARLRERVQALEAALRPFAGQARIIAANEQRDGECVMDYESFRLRGSYAAISVADCRRAVKALES